MKRFVTTSCVCLLLSARIIAAPAEAWYVRSVHFVGNKTFSSKTLLARMALRPPLVFGKVRFSREILDDDLETITSFYRNEGFLDAIVTLQRVEYDSTKRRVDIWVEVSEGPRTIVTDVVIFGNRAYPDSFYLQLLETQPGEPLRASRIDRDVRRIADVLGRRGYLAASVAPEVRLDRENAMAVVEFTVREGAPIRVGEIRMEGLEMVRPHVVRRELRFRENQLLRLDDIQESIRRLYQTALFRSVEIQPQFSEGDSSVVPVVVRVSETQFGQLEGGIGFGTYDKLRASIEASYGNLWGTGRKAGLAARVSFVRQKGEVVYSDPWAFGLPLRLDLGAYYEHQDERSYEAVLRGIRWTLGTQSRQRHIFRLAFREEAVRWLRLLGQPPGDLRAKNTRSLTASYAFDVRNDLFNPTKGTYFLAQIEVAGLGGPGTNQFTKLIVDWRGYRPWREGAYVSGAIRIGWVQEYGQSKEVPIQERFFAGGARTVRGFGEKQLGPKTATNIPTGGRFSLILNPIEVRFPFWKWFGGAVFLDVGNVWDRPEQASLKGLRWVAGFGLRLASPIGVLRLDLGLKLDRAPGESLGAVLVDMGQAF